MLNSYYICDKQAWMDNVDLFHPSLGSHYIDLPNGQILVSANFPDNHYSQDAFESLSGVMSLPHPVFEGTKPLDQTHVDALTCAPDVAVGQTAPAAVATSIASDVPLDEAPNPLAGITTANTVIDVANIVAQINPLMKLRSF
jgi:hypothetical protein